MALTQIKVIFLTNSELGQANICLAVAYEFLLRSEFSVHIASFSPLAKEVEQFNTRVSNLTSKYNSVATFHIVDGLSMKDASAKKNNDDGYHSHGHGFFAASKVYETDLIGALDIWSGPEYMNIHDNVVKIIQELEPDIIVMDPLFYQAIDACRTLHRDCIWLSPNTFKEHTQQSSWVQRLRQPAVCSGYSYPVPLWLIIPNFILTMRLTSAILGAKSLMELNKYRNDHGLSGPVPSYTETKDVFVLLPAAPQIDFPCEVPPNFISCGPIILPDQPCAQKDPDLAKWLADPPTVMINLGSHFQYDDESAGEVVEAIHTLLAQRSNIQILWKMQDRKMKPVKSNVFDSIKNFIIGGQVKVLKWLTVDPASILKTGNIICAVHHGGANSYYEAIKAGVPQIILPQWFDTYDFAARVEYLHIGVWGSRSAAPGISGVELGRAFLQVLCSRETQPMREKARQLAHSLPREEGRVIACDKIIAIHDTHTRNQTKLVS